MSLVSHGRRHISVFLFLALLGGIINGPQIEAQAPASGLRIVIIDGEDAVNVIQQKTAVAPMVEVRDRNDQPVSGAVVRFAIRSGRATFTGGRSLSVTTNAAGRAAATGFAPTGTGALQISATATFQSQTAVITIAQTNVMTAAQAAAVSASGTGGSSAASASAGAGGGGGLSPTTLVAIAGAAAGGAVATKKLTSRGRTFEGQFSGTLPMAFATCTRLEQQTGTLTITLTEEGATVQGTAKVDGNITFAPGPCTVSPSDTFGIGDVPVNGSPGSVVFTGEFANNFAPSGNIPGGVNSYTYVFSGSLSGDQIVGTLRVSRTISNPGVPNAPPPSIGSVTHNVTLR